MPEYVPLFHYHLSYPRIILIVSNVLESRLKSSAPTPEQQVFFLFSSSFLSSSVIRSRCTTESEEQINTFTETYTDEQGHDVTVTYKVKKPDFSDVVERRKHWKKFGKVANVPLGTLEVGITDETTVRFDPPKTVRFISFSLFY